MRKIHQNVPLAFVPYEWKVVETEYSEQTNKINETIFSLANGYIGVRGFFEEGFYGNPNESDPSVMINGVYEYYPYHHIWCRPGFPERFHSIVNNVNPLSVRISADGEEINLKGRISGYSRTLDMQKGNVTREFTFATAGGKKVGLKFTRVVSQTEKHLLADRIEILADKGVKIAVTSELKALSGTVKAQKAEIGSDMTNPFELIGLKTDNKCDILAYKTIKSGFSIACAAAEDISVAAETTEEKAEDGVKRTYLFVSDGKKATYVRFGALAADKDEDKGGDKAGDKVAGCDADYRELASSVVVEAKKEGFDKILKDTENYWKEYWDTSDIEIKGDVAVQQGIRFGMFMINQSAGRDGKTNVSANGLTGTAYSGHTFWDTEIFMSPMFLYAHPEEVKKLLIYRYNILPKAKERAAQMDDVGALYSWNSINGEECGHVFEAATAQYHINNDVFYSIFKYYEATLDWEFMENYGAEILLETSKCLSHRGNFIDRKGGRFCINCICGPDEYNPVVDNNLYTNFLTKKQFYFTLEIFEKLRAKNPQKYAALKEKCGIDDEELSRMKEAADKMYLPFDAENGIYMQDDNFIYKDPIDIEKIPLDKLPLLTHLHPLNLWRYQVCKQADIVLLMFLQSHEFTEEMRRKIFDFYEPKTIHDSSLSASIHSIVACDIGYRDEAYGYLRQACRMDLDNVNRNTCYGIHAACMGSCYMMIVNGFAGMRIYDGRIHFKPYKPENWEGYSFKITFRGSVFGVEAKNDKIGYTLLSAESITITSGDETVILNEIGKTVYASLCTTTQEVK